MKNKSIYGRLLRTLRTVAAALTAAALMTCCWEDDKMITELPKPDGGGGQGTTEITPDEGITLYGLVSDEEQKALQSERRRNALRSQLDAAVREVRYEDAARLRDELRALPQE